MNKPATELTTSRKAVSSRLDRPAGLQAMNSELYHQLRLAIEELDGSRGSKRS